MATAVFSKNEKKGVIVVGIILLLLISIYLIGFHKGTKKTTIAPIIADDPNAATGSETGINNPAGLSEPQIKQLAVSLHTDMDGSNFFGHNDDLYKQVTELSDTDISRLYNAFNDKYQQTSGQTLYQWLEAEYGSWSGAVFANLRSSILERMGKLNLK